MKTATRFVNYVQVECPECSKQNWVCGGDPDDVSGEDPYIIKCWDCLKLFTLFEDELGFEDQDAEPVLGSERP